MLPGVCELALKTILRILCSCTFSHSLDPIQIGQSEAVAASRIKQQHLLYCPAAILTRSQTAKFCRDGSAAIGQRVSA
jgi:hypothetical protein